MLNDDEPNEQPSTPTREPERPSFPVDREEKTEIIPPKTE